MTSNLSDGPLTFLTPYWSGAEMMRIHLASIRRYHPRAPILVSKRGGGREEMEGYREQFGVQYWVEECGYMDAYLRLLQRCETDYACILDHDVVLLAGVDPLLREIAEGRCDVVGIEERIRVPAGMQGPDLPFAARGWIRFAPGDMASNFIVFHWRAFREKWGLRGVLAGGARGVKDHEFDYGIGRRLARHKYLRPYHVRRYGLGNLVMDGDAPVLWHQWYGSYRTRLLPGGAFPDESAAYAQAEAGERALIADAPAFDFSAPVPAWGPEFDVDEERRAFEHARRRGPRHFLERVLRTLRRWRDYGARGMCRQVAARVDRWWRLR